jgi:hypothetical protein
MKKSPAPAAAPAPTRGEELPSSEALHATLASANAATTAQGEPHEGVRNRRCPERFARCNMAIIFDDPASAGSRLGEPAVSSG